MDRGVNVWDFLKQEKIALFHGALSEMGRIAFSPDAKYLAADNAGGSGMSGAVLWDLQQKKISRNCESLPFQVPDDEFPGGSVMYGWGIAISPDGATIAVGGSHLGLDGTLSTWDLDSGKRLWSETMMAGPTTAIAFSPDGSMLASGSYGGVLRIWDVASRKQTKEIAAHANGMLHLAYAPDGTAIISAGGADGSIKIWDVQTGNLLHTFDSRDRAVGTAVCRVTYCADGTKLATGHRDGWVIVWDLNSRRIESKRRHGDRPVHSVAFSPDGNYLASGGLDGRLLIWKLPR